MAKVDFEEASVFNDWRFRSVTLPNDIKILLVSAARFNYAMVGVNVVNAGTFTQPKHHPSQLPRLVALALDFADESSEKYLLQQAFEKRNGSMEKKTGPDFSTFNVTLPDTETGLKVALDWVSAMLKSPSFPIAELEKTVTEMRNSLLEDFSYDDQKRVNFLHELTAKTDHPLSKTYFGIAAFDEQESDILSGNLLRDAVLEYFQTHFNTSSMYALVQGSQNLDELQKMVEESFGEIEKLGDGSVLVDQSYKNDCPYGIERCKRMLQIVPVDDSENNTLILKFLVSTGESTTTMDHYSVGVYLEEMLPSNNGPLLKILRDEKGWVGLNKKKYGPTFSADVTFPFDGCMCFQFKMKLTETGMENVDGIMQHVLLFIRTVEKREYQAWFWEETKIRKVFRRRMFNNYIVDYSWAENALDVFTMTNSPELAMESVYGTNLVDKLDETLVATLLRNLVVENARITLLSKTFEDKATLEVLGVKYHEEEIRDEVLESWRAIRHGYSDMKLELEMPSPSEFVPPEEERHKKVTSADWSTDVQHLPMTSESLSHVWLRQNDSLKCPQVYVRLELLSPIVNTDTKTMMLNQMYGFMLSDEICGYSCGLFPQIEPTATGIMISVDWYAATLEKTVASLLESFSTAVPVEKRFNSLRYTWIGTQNSILKSDGACQYGTTGEALITPLMTPRDKLVALKAVSYADMVEYTKRFQNKMRLNWLIYGKITAGEVTKMVEICDAIFIKKGTTKVVEREIIRRRQALVPKGTRWAHTWETETDTLSCTTVHFQNAELDPLSNGLVQFLANLLNDEVYERLHVDEGLTSQGCAGASTEQLYPVDGRKSLFMYVDSSKWSPAYVESRTDNLLLQLKKRLESMEEQEFQKKKNAFIKRLWNPDHHDNVVEKLFAEILLGEGGSNFSRYEEQAKALKDVGLAAFIMFFEEFVGITPGKARRFTLMVGKGPSQSQDSTEAHEDIIPVAIGNETAEQITELSSWLLSLPTVPAEE